jgi:hypothetical protein
MFDVPRVIGCLMRSGGPSLLDDFLAVLAESPPSGYPNTKRVDTVARLGGQVAIVGLVLGSPEGVGALGAASRLRGIEERLQFGAVQQGGSAITRSCPERTRRCSLDRLTSYLSAAFRILRYSVFAGYISCTSQCSMAAMCVEWVSLCCFRSWPRFLTGPQGP